MKKTLFLVALLFCIATTGAAHLPATSVNRSIIKDGVHRYTGTLAVTTVAGITTSYTGRNIQAATAGGEAEFTLFRVPVGAGSLTVNIGNVQYDTTTGAILPQSETGIMILNVALTGNIYGNNLSDASCDLEFDVEATGGLVRFRFTGHSTD